MSSENKLRLLMIYVATHPEKLDATKRLQWMKLARLSGDEMNAVTNLEFLGVQVSKKQPQSGVEKLALKFGARKSKRPLRRTREQDEESWQLSRFYPLIQDVVEDIDKGVLSREEYPYLKEPSGSAMHSSSPSSRPPTAPHSKPVQSMRTTAKGPGTTWASRGRAPSDDGYSSDSVLKTAVSDPKINGKRIFVFIIGGMTRSEVCPISAGLLESMLKIISILAGA
jgi:syntaxin-binding protein 1